MECDVCSVDLFARDCVGYLQFSVVLYDLMVILKTFYESDRTVVRTTTNL
jgi:hypothetical protein